MGRIPLSRAQDSACVFSIPQPSKSTSYGADKSPPKPKPPMWGLELNSPEEIHENWERLVRRYDAYITSIRPDKPKNPTKPKKKKKKKKVNKKKQSKEEDCVIC